MDGPIGQELLKKMEAKGVKGLCWGGGWGFRHMLPTCGRSWRRRT